MLAEEVESGQLKVRRPYKRRPDSASTEGYALVSGFLPVQLQVDVDFFLAVEARYRPRLRLRRILFRVNLVVDVRIQPAEAIVALLVGNRASNRVAAGVFQENDRRAHRRLRFIHGHAMDRSQLRFLFRVLRDNARSQQRQRCDQAEEPHPPHHFFPPAAACIRNTTLSSLIPLVPSTVRTWSTKPFW